MQTYENCKILQQHANMLINYIFEMRYLERKQIMQIVVVVILYEPRVFITF